MSTANPTGLKVGASGILDGHNCKVTGRVVLGVTIDGETYYWNEYQLADETGSTAILVYEEEESGPTWKLFLPLELLRGFSALDAARYKLGDSVVFDDLRAQVSLVSQSRVYHIEGEAPEGVAMGDVANYFNAQAGNRMLVASWTGDEIEYYKGRNLPAQAVTQAFKLPAADISLAALSRMAGGQGRAVSGQTLAVVLMLLGGVVVFGARSCSSDETRVDSPPARIAAGANPLTAGAGGMIHGALRYNVWHALAEIDTPGGNYQGHEYLLSPDPGRKVLVSPVGLELLVQGMERDNRDWFLLKPVTLPPAYTPFGLAKLDRGGAIRLDDMSYSITTLLTGWNESDPGQWPGFGTRAFPFYGLIARSAADEWLLVRWTDARAEAFLGGKIPEQEVAAAFAAKR